MKTTWAEQWANDNQRWPDTNLVRMLKGSWETLDFDKKKYPQQIILDMGCGDASFFPLYLQCGFKEIYGVEIDEETVSVCNKKYGFQDRICEVRMGRNDAIPFASGMFDYIISWNEFYYMGTPEKYYTVDDYLDEFSRVMKPDGCLVFSIPMFDHRIYKDCEEIGDGYVIIRNDPRGIRNGIVMKRFRDEKDIAHCFERHFQGFQFGSCVVDFFGNKNEMRHHLGYCMKGE